MVQETGERVAACLIGELTGGPIEIRHDAFDDQPVDRVVEAALDLDHISARERCDAPGDEPPEHAAQQQELGHDLARREPERFALPRVVARDRRERPSDPHPFGHRVLDLAAELGDEGRYIPELRHAPETDERGDDVVIETLLDDLERQFPPVRAQLGTERRER